jgi:hypothetical protein
VVSLERVGIEAADTDAALVRLASDADRVVVAYNKAATASDGFAAAQKRAGDAAAAAAAKTLAAQAREGAADAQSLVGNPSRVTPRSLSNAVLSAVAPAAGARNTVSGINEEIAATAAVAAEADLRLGEYAAALARVNEAGAALVGKSRLAEDFFAQKEALERATAAYEVHRVEVLRLAGAIDAADMPTAQMTAELQRAQRALAGAAKATERESDQLAILRSRMDQAGVETTSFAAAQNQLTAASQRAAAAQVQLQSKVGSQGGGGFLGLKPYELQNLSFQVNDFFTQIASGTPVTQAFAQQAGQVYQIFPGIGAAIMGALPAILAGGAAIGSLAIVIGQYTERADALKKFSGELALNADGFRYNAEAVAANVDELDGWITSTKDATAAVSRFIREGIVPEKLESFTRAAKNLSDVTGTDMKQAIDLVAEGFTGGYDAVAKLDDQFNFLSDSQRETIKDMYENGKATDAARVAYGIFDERVSEAARKAKGPWKEAFEALAGATETLADQTANAIADVLGLTDALDGLEANLRKAAQSWRVYAFERGRGSAVDPQTSTQDILSSGRVEALRQQIARQQQVLDNGSADRNGTAPMIRKQIGEARSQLTALETRLARDKVEVANLDPVAQQRDRLNDEKKADAEAARAGRSAKAARAKEEREAKAARAKALREAKAHDREVERTRKDFERSQEKTSNNLNSVLGLVGRGDQVSLGARLDAIKGQFAKFYDDLDELKTKAAAAGKSTAEIRVDGRTISEIEGELDRARKILDRRATVDFYSDLTESVRKARDDQIRLISQLSEAGIITAEESFKRQKEAAQAAGIEIAKASNQTLLKLAPLGTALQDNLDQAKAALAAVRTAPPRGGATATAGGVEQVTVTAERFNNLASAVTAAEDALAAFNAQKQRAEVAAATATGDTAKAVREAGLAAIAKVQEQLDVIEASRARRVGNIQRQVAERQVTEIEGNRLITQTYAETAGTVDELVDRMQSLLVSMEQLGVIAPAAADTLRGGFEDASNAAKATDENLKAVVQTIESGVLSGVDSGVDSFVAKLGEVLDGTAKIEDLWSTLGNTVRSTIASILIDLSKMILKAAVLEALMKIPAFKRLYDKANGNTAEGLKDASSALVTAAAPWAAVIVGLQTSAAALQAAAVATSASSASSGGGNKGGGIFSAIAGLFGVHHSGGIVGDPSRSRQLSLGPRAGLDSTERMIIAQKGEEVLTPDDPRHVSNWGKGGGASGGQGDAAFTVTNILDAEAVTRLGLNSRAGESGVLTIIQKNAPAVKSALGVA